MRAAAKRGFRGAAVVLLAAIFLSAAGAFLQAGVCEDAFLRCCEDPVNGLFLTGGAYCFNGYMFCLKYVQPWLDRGV